MPTSAMMKTQFDRTAGLGLKFRTARQGIIKVIKELYMSRWKDRKMMSKKIGRLLTRFEVVHHIDGNPDNGQLKNLKLMSLSDHTSYHYQSLSEIQKIKWQRCSRIIRPAAKLTIEDVHDIRKMLKDGIRQRLIALAFGVYAASISSINTGATWSWV